MAKKSGRERDVFTPTTPSLTQLLAPYPLRPPPVLLPVPVLDPIDIMEAPGSDRRSWRPDRATRPPGSINRLSTVLTAPTLNSVAFSEPKHVALCVRRKQRKQVLFAKRKTGKGARAPRRRRNFWSDVKC